MSSFTNKPVSRIIISLILTAIGITGMQAGIFADVGVMVIAVLNATRTLRVK